MSAANNFRHQMTIPGNAEFHHAKNAALMILKMKIKQIFIFSEKTQYM